MLMIDGMLGEGGGQILRTSLALSLVTGKPFIIKDIRAGRKKPGLMRQHLTCVNAAVKVGNAAVEGANIGSQSLEFEPGAVNPGSYHFAIGTAGSCTLVFQT
ncbi:MAG: RNA 3'-terminal phosphate cyclase, partial [Desulfobacterales bacterium]|nr:RNA 3'-terminal phosphate cyclase [Desulfobacterales bacterium]